MAIETKIVDGIEFDKNTPDRVVRVLLNLMNQRPRQRVRLFYGDQKTGRDYCEEYDTMGYIGRSGGRVSIPLLINNKNSSGGPGILTGSIVRITVNRMDYYRHPKYHIGKVELKPSVYSTVPYGVFINGKNYANFKTAEKARKWAEFIQGNTNTKG